jgi:hypothetical protein
LHRHLAKEHSKLTLETWLEEEGISLPRAKSPNKRIKSPKKGRVGRPASALPSEAVFLEPTCKLCQMEMKSVLHSKRHYLHHFRKIFMVSTSDDFRKLLFLLT